MWLVVLAIVRMPSGHRKNEIGAISVHHGTRHIWAGTLHQPSHPHMHIILFQQLFLIAAVIALISYALMHAGLYDPWSAFGVLSDVSRSVVSVLIPEGAHHVDLMFRWVRQKARGEAEGKR